MLTKEIAFPTNNTRHIIIHTSNPRPEAGNTNWGVLGAIGSILIFGSHTKMQMGGQMFFNRFWIEFESISMYFGLVLFGCVSILLRFRSIADRLRLLVE